MAAKAKAKAPATKQGYETVSWRDAKVYRCTYPDCPGEFTHEDLDLVKAHVAEHRAREGG